MFISENLKTYQTKETSYTDFFTLCKISKKSQKIILEKSDSLYEFLQNDKYYHWAEEITDKEVENIKVYVNSIINLMNPFIKEKCSLNGVNKVKEYLKLKVAEIEKDKIWKFLANCSSEDLTEIKKALKK